MKTFIRIALIVCALGVLASAQEPQTIQPAELAKVLQAGKDKPLILSVGPKLLYQQAHIVGAEYIGATSSPDGIAALRERVKSLPKDKAIVVYCGCCPWSHCPNIRPAYAELVKLGFKNVKALYIGNNFGTDWVNAGYPTAKGQ